MARNYNKVTRRKAKKIEPAVLRFQVALPTLTQASPVGTSYVDLSQIASVLNRRFYRQGLNWAVADIKHMATTSDGSNVSGLVDIQKCPNTWVFHNAWEKGFRAWQKMNNEALSETESIKPKFLDFKIYADADHHNAGIGANLLPLDGAGGLYTAGEWESSKYVYSSSPTTNAVVTAEVIGVGANFPGASAATGFNAVSLIEGYAASRALPDVLDPNVPADADDVGPTATPENWLGALFTEGTEQDATVLNDMQTENNIAPYPFENDGVHVDTMYPGGANQAPTLQEHDTQYITGTTVGGHTHLVGGLFPCGLMKITTSATVTGDTQVFQGLYIELCPGDHRGYLAESMS